MSWYPPTCCSGTFRTTSPSSWGAESAAIPSPQRGRVHPPYILAFECERQWGWNSPLGQPFIPGSREEMPFTAAQDSDPFISCAGTCLSPRTFVRSCSSSPNSPGLLRPPGRWVALRAAVHAGTLGRAWRASKCSPSPQCQVKLLAARNVRMQLRVAVRSPWG